jgi:integrase
VGKAHIPLGKYSDRKAVKAEYDRLLAQFLTQGHLDCMRPTGHEITVKILLLEFLKTEQTFCKSVSELSDIQRVCNAFATANGAILVDNLGPEHFDFFLSRLIEGHFTGRKVKGTFVPKKPTRGYILEQLKRLYRVFKWAVASRKFSGEKWLQITEWMKHRQDSSFGEQSKRVEPVSDRVVEMTLPFLSPVVRDMVVLQGMIGCRPSELCNLHGSIIDRTGEDWIAELTEHKNAKRGKRRTIPFHGKAKAIVEKYIKDGDSFLFSPKESETIRLGKQATGRRKGNKPGEHYTKDSYARAIVRACDKAFPPPDGLSETKAEQWRKDHRWSPNRLRHSVASKLIATQGIEHAAAMLGHASTKTTERYTRSASEQLTEQRAIEAARLLGS